MRRVLITSLLVNFAFAMPGVAPVESEDKEGVAQKARAAYYNLPRLGVASYRCEAVTEWGVMLAGEVDPEALKKNGGAEILNGIHIWMTIGKSGDPKFEQRLDGPISDPKRKEIVDTLVRKQEKVLTSFARDATRYMFTSMIPSPDHSYKLEEKGWALCNLGARGIFDRQLHDGEGLQDQNERRILADRPVHRGEIERPRRIQHAL
jgi:hypothetical protein